MYAKLMRSFLIAALAAALPICASAASQTDVAVNGYGSLNTTSNTSSGLAQIPADSIGGMLELRHIVSSLVGFEGTYSYNRANQEYSNPVSCAGASCPLAPYAASVSAVANQITGDWVFTFKVKKIHLFAVGGGGVILIQPSKGTVYSYSLAASPAFQSAPASTSSVTSPAFDYGFGGDWAVRKHLGVRFQYRGVLYKAPALTTALGSTKVMTQTYEPMVGVFYRF